MQACSSVTLRGLVIYVLAFGSTHAAADAPTAAEVIARIQRATGGAGAWHDDTVDTFKAGDPQTPVTGIATTFSATMDVLERAVAHHRNLIISHEPVFYNHFDETAWLANDPVYQHKRDFIAQHHLVLWRFHDHIHQSPAMPDMIQQAMVAALHWQALQDKSNPARFHTPPITLAALAAQIRERLHIRMLRVIGDPSFKVTSFAFIPGAAPRATQIGALRDEGVQVLVAGESAEWETVLYVQDSVAPQRKSLILLGHEPSEELGMQACAQWLKPLVPEAQVEFIPVGEPFWSPQSPH